VVHASAPQQPGLRLATAGSEAPAMRSAAPARPSSSVRASTTTTSARPISDDRV
jgi:hypothetical protein